MRHLFAALGISLASTAPIPRRLITSHKLPLAETPEALRQNVEQWQTSNPTFAFGYFDDAAQRAWMPAAPRGAQSVALDVRRVART